MAGLRFDCPCLNPERAADMAGVSPDTAVRLARKHGLAYQIGGRGCPVRIHPIGWSLLVAGDLSTLDELKRGQITNGVRKAYSTMGLLPPDEDT